MKNWFFYDHIKCKILGRAGRATNGKMPISPKKNPSRLFYFRQIRLALRCQNRERPRRPATMHLGRRPSSRFGPSERVFPDYRHLFKIGLKCWHETRMAPCLFVKKCFVNFWLHNHQLISIQSSIIKKNPLNK